jgi:hypothetical protein
MISAISTAARDTDRRDPHHHPFGVSGAGAQQSRPCLYSLSGLKDQVADVDASIGEVRTVTDLKLGPLPKQSTVKVTIVLPELLKEELDAYAAEHGKNHSRPTKTAELIPHILEAFLRTDRAWCSRRKQMRQAQTRQRRASPTN